MMQREIPPRTVGVRRKATAIDHGVESLEGRTLLASLGPVASPTPLSVTVEIGRWSDPDGNGVMLRPRAVVTGRTAPGALVTLDRGDDGTAERAARADAAGRFAFLVPLEPGRTPLRIAARDAFGDRAEAALTATRGDAVLAWNATLLDTIRETGAGPTRGTRSLAMVHLAMADAVDAATGGRTRYAYDGPARPGASPEAAASEAAFGVLAALEPDRMAELRVSRREGLAAVPAGPSRTLGVRLGAAVAAAMLARRADDGAAAASDYAPAAGPGNWTPTPPEYLPGLDPQWGGVAPFVVADVAQFRPDPPPALESPAYAAAYAEVRALGGVASVTRTADQTAAAEFWADLPGRSFTPPGHWNQIAREAALDGGLGLAGDARLFATLNAALADAAICCWDAKYAYIFWRPETAIRAGDADGNPATAGDPGWAPLWASPNFPAYTSGHSTFSGAAQVVLESAFGTAYAFDDGGDPALGLPARSFASVAAAAEEAGSSRIYGGIHFAFDNVAGLRSGRAIGRAAVAAIGGAASNGG